jgi:hypothetical protein
LLHDDDKTNHIHIQQVLQKNYGLDVLQGLITHQELFPKGENIIIKIGPVNKIIRHEYEISQLLYTQGASGFIRYYGMFSCYDHRHSIHDIAPLCSANHIPRNEKDVIIMPFIQHGSIESHHWSTSSIPQLRSLIKQTILVLVNAYHNYGFLHNDVHLGNILFQDTTTQTGTIQATDSRNIPNEGFEVILTDFAMSFFAKQSIETCQSFVQSLQGLFTQSRIQGDGPNIMVRMVNDIPIILFLNQYDAAQYREPKDLIEPLFDLLDDWSVLFILYSTDKYLSVE